MWVGNSELWKTPRTWLLSHLSNSTVHTQQKYPAKPHVISQFLWNQRTGSRSLGQGKGGNQLWDIPPVESARVLNYQRHLICNCFVLQCVRDAFFLPPAFQMLTATYSVGITKLFLSRLSKLEMDPANLNYCLKETPLHISPLKVFGLGLSRHSLVHSSSLLKSRPEQVSSISLVTKTDMKKSHVTESTYPMVVPFSSRLTADQLLQKHIWLFLFTSVFMRFNFSLPFS